MTTFSVRAWSAWAPGVSTAEEWSRWARDPSPLDGEETPSLEFVPPMQRRRFSRLSKMALRAAFDACSAERLSETSTVFASRHGEVEACLALLHDIARELPVSPTAFSHSVHNTQAGLFSITAKNARPSSSIAAMEDTFCTGLIEALGLCESQRSDAVLLVVADETVPELFDAFVDEAPSAYAMALLVGPGIAPGFPAFRLERASAPRSSDGRAEPSRSGDVRRPLPQALEFLSWMLGEGDTLALRGRRGGWTLGRASIT